MKMNIIVGTARKVILTRVIKEKVEAMGYKVNDIQKWKMPAIEVPEYLMDRYTDGFKVAIMKDYEQVHDFDEWNDTYPEMERVYLVEVETGVNVFISSNEMEVVKYALSDRIENLIAAIPYVKDAWEREWQGGQATQSINILVKMGFTSMAKEYHEELERVMKEGDE